MSELQLIKIFTKVSIKYFMYEIYFIYSIKVSIISASHSFIYYCIATVFDVSKLLLILRRFRWTKEQ